MTCIISNRAIICFNPSYRLRLSNGQRVFMAWHNYLGPLGFYKDKLKRREIVEWWDNPLICETLEWFCKRGNKG